MMDRLFGMKSGPRELMYRCFLRLPRFAKAAAIGAFCRAGRRQVSKLPTPSRLIFYVTNRCNARCKHCFFAEHINKGTDEELSLQEIERFAGSLKTRLRSLNLTGGEPVLRPDFVDICRIFYEANRTVLITFPTNGLLPDRVEATLTAILEGTGLKVNAQVSLDGLRETHDEIRGVAGCFDKALTTLRMLQDLKASFANLNNVSAISVISRRNYRELGALIDFVKDELGVFHKLQFARSSHRDVRNIDPDVLSDLDPSDQEGSLPPVEALVEIYETANRRLRDHDASLLSKRQRLLMEHALAVLLHDRKTLTCLAGQIDGVVYATGEVAMCEMTRAFASLRDYDLDFHRLWHSQSADDRRAQIRACYCTHPCNISTSMSYDRETLLALADRSPCASLIDWSEREG